MRMSSPGFAVNSFCAIRMFSARSRADTSEEVLTNWDAIKMNTKGYTTQTQSLRSVSGRLSGI